MTVGSMSRARARLAGRIAAAVCLAAALTVVSSNPAFTGGSDASASAASAPIERSVARASRTGPRTPLPVTVPADLEWSIDGVEQARAMADAVAAQIEAQRVAAELAAAAEAQAAADAAIEAAAVEAQAAKAAKRSAATGPAPTSPVPSSGSIKEYASGLVGGGDQFACLDKLFERESGWNYQADNPNSSAYGIPQALPGSKMASAGADWETNPETQVRWGVGYINGRYGTPCDALAASNAKGWY